MHINVITVNSGWILQKIAERIVSAAPEGVTMKIGYPRWNERNFYVDVQNCFGGKRGMDIGLFTHVHENDIQYLAAHWFQLDHVIHMSQRNEYMWSKDKRYTPATQSSSCMIPGEMPPGFEFKKRRIGIAQRGKYEGKGFHFMLKLIKDYPQTVSLFDWLFVGNDWEEVIAELSKITNAMSITDSEAIWPDTYNRFYSEIDYLLIPSKWEGGPMGLLEAAASGVPVIGAMVGWVDMEVPVFKSFHPGDANGLANILHPIGQYQQLAYQKVKDLSYAKYAQHVVDCFKEVEKRRCTR